MCPLRQHVSTRQLPKDLTIQYSVCTQDCQTSLTLTFLNLNTSSDTLDNVSPSARPS